MASENIKTTLLRVAEYYDQKKVGAMGPLGFRRSTDLRKLLNCLDYLVEHKLLIPGESNFLDMGCADGRVNVFFSYLMKRSIGIELDEWTLDEYGPLLTELKDCIEKEGLMQPPDNISLFHGDSIDEALYQKIYDQIQIHFHYFDIFYTYLTMQKEFAEMITAKAKKGAVFMVCGLEKIIPSYEGLELLTPEESLEGILAVYRKI